jgi:hypothetical protein
MSQASIWSPGETAISPPGQKAAILELSATASISTDIGPENNALSIGPLELTLGTNISVPPGRRWVIL